MVKGVDFIKMLLKTVANSLKSEWFLKLTSTIANSMNNFNEFKLRDQIQTTRSNFLEKERRVLDAITMRREPDRVPVAVGGLNFFPAKYAGISCAEYMYDYKKTKMAYLKMHEDFEFDLTFPSFMLCFGKVLSAAEVNLVKIPGRDLNLARVFLPN